jgi:hypothetical protein
VIPDCSVGKVAPSPAGRSGRNQDTKVSASIRTSPPGVRSVNDTSSPSGRVPVIHGVSTTRAGSIWPSSISQPSLYFGDPSGRGR